MTKTYNVSILISEPVYQTLDYITQKQCRFVSTAVIRGKQNKIKVWEVFSADPELQLQQKLAINDTYHQAIELYQNQLYPEALKLFKTCLESIPGDTVIEFYIQECHTFCDSTKSSESLVKVGLVRFT